MILLPRKILAVTTNLAMFSSKTTIFTVGFQPQQLHGASRRLFTKSSKRLNWLLQEMTNMPPYYDIAPCILPPNVTIHFTDINTEIAAYITLTLWHKLPLQKQTVRRNPLLGDCLWRRQGCALYVLSNQNLSCNGGFSTALTLNFLTHSDLCHSLHVF